MSAEKQRQENVEFLKGMNNAVFSKRGLVKTGSWRGVRAIKYPTDLMLYAEIIFEQKPDLIIETGTRYGGAALFYADMCKLQNYGKVVTIEIDEQFESPKHQKITTIIGSSLATETLEKVAKLEKDTALVILDSDHSPEHIYAELVAYAPFVHIGGYIVVEDAFAQDGYSAIDKFLAENPNFVVDREIERYGIHAAQGGFLKRIS